MKINKLLYLLGIFWLTGCSFASNAGSLPTLIPTNEPIALQPSATPSITRPPATLPPTFTPRPTNTATFTPTPSATPTVTPSPSSTPTITPTPFPYPNLDATLPTPETAVPTPVPTFAIPDDITLIALLGNDGDDTSGGRTDSIILVAINKQTKTATMLSLPRDLYVPAPGWQMVRINQVLPHGFSMDYPDGGKGLLRDTLLWNFGVPIDNYVRIGFSGFKEAINALGGVEVPVTCPLRDWRLKSPELDQTVEENWEQFTLEPGVYLMDGDLALWYARSRRTTSDFQRGRRQQQIIHAMLEQGLNRDLIPQVPTLWDAYRQSVETDLGLTAVLELAALAPAIRDNGIRHLTLPYSAFQSWTVPSSGAAVQLIQWEAAQPVFAQLLQPSALNRGGRPLTVEIITQDENRYKLAAENLAWFGIIPVFTPSGEPDPPTTSITLHAPNDKGAFSWVVAWVFGRRSDAIALQGNTEYPTNYTVRLGADFDPCRPLLEAPRP
ncbi:MAG: LCP family protein [Ardenticatenaceae bacterium]|nr:LCP family protein [Ardenticatenaceae bacterium]